MNKNERPSDVSNRVTADDQTHDVDDVDLEAQREVFLAMDEEFDDDAYAKVTFGFQL